MIPETMDVLAAISLKQSFEAINVSAITAEIINCYIDQSPPSVDIYPKNYGPFVEVFNNLNF